MRTKKWLWLTLLVAWAFLLSGLGADALASSLVAQTPLPGKSFTKYLDPLPFFGRGGLLPGSMAPSLSP